MSRIRAFINRFSKRTADLPPASVEAFAPTNDVAIDAGPIPDCPGDATAPAMAAPSFPPFPPPVIPPYPSTLKWAWGDIHVHAYMHTGAVLEGGYGGGKSVVIHGWGTPGARKGHVVERTIVGWDVGRDREHCTYPCAALTRGGGYPRRLVRSLTPLIQDGTCSDDPALLVVPYGRYVGLMLGQLTAAEKQELLGTVRRWDARNAIKQANFWPHAYEMRQGLRTALPELPERVQFSVTNIVEQGRATWVVGMVTILPREQFEVVNDRARQLGGQYRSVQRGATISGFHFADELRAKEFMGLPQELAVSAGESEASQQIRA